VTKNFAGYTDSARNASKNLKTKFSTEKGVVDLPEKEYVDFLQESPAPAS
jgi:hypothetical protein